MLTGSCSSSAHSAVPGGPRIYGWDSRVAQSAEPGSPTYYVIEYAVANSRGKKMYLCKYCIAQRKLYVLQTQAVLDSYDADADNIRTQLNSIVASFVVGG